MIFNMPKTVKEGSEITVTLRFERSGEKKHAGPFPEGVLKGPTV